MNPQRFFTKRFNSRAAVILALSLLFFGKGDLFAAGVGTGLMERARTVFGPLPATMPSPDNPGTPAKVKLGKTLFFEPRISIDGTVSCARCHPLGLYAADGLRKSVGNTCKVLPRNAPTLFNAAAQISQHWDGGRTSVEDQARQSVTGPPAFGMPSEESVEKILKSMPGYAALFKEAFPGDKEPVTMNNFALAVGAFERTLLTPAPFDDFLKGNESALTEQQKRGLQAFMDLGCMNCHFSPFVGGQTYQKFGVYEPYETYTKSVKVDEGRFAGTKKDGDQFVFKVPVLRNAAVTPPYFHDGSVTKLEDAIVIMARIQLKKDLAKEQTGDIGAFFQSLTGTIPEATLIMPVLPARD